MYAYQYPQPNTQQYAQRQVPLQMRQMNMQLQLHAQMEQQRQAYVLQNSRPANTPRAPPRVSPADAIIGNTVGVPVHICNNNEKSCMKCHSHLENPEHNYVVSSTRQPLKHSAINILHATRYRTASLKVPRPMQGRIDAFDFTVQLSELPADDTAWLFAKDRLLAIIGQLSNNVVMVRKPGGESLSMTRIGTLGERYVVEWCLQAAPGNPDVGMWSWYRYQDGGYRVYNYTTLGSGPPTLVAWKEPSDWHWNFHEHVVMNPYKAEAAMILIMIGIVICSDMGRGLTNY